MNEAASELQGTFNEFILFAIYYEMCNKSQTVYFFVPIMVNFWDRINLNSVNKPMRFIIEF